MKRNQKQHFNGNIFVKIAGAGVFTAVVCILLLFLTGLIPKSSIEENSRKSAVYFDEKELFLYLIDGQFNTRQDNYADCILINIMYHVKQEDLADSLIRASYYHDKNENVNDSFLAATKEEKEPNVDYFRYWHGSMVLLRPLFVFTDIEGARLFLGLLLIMLILAVIVMTARRGNYPLAISYFLGNMILQIWMTMFCIEYITVPIAANIAVLLTMLIYEKYKMDQKKAEESILCLLAGTGVATCFVDFLTTETLSVTLPLLFYILLRFQDGKLKELKEEVIFIIKAGISWGLGYAAMFLLKWLLSAIFVGKEAFLQALSSAGERISGAVTLGNTNLDPTASAGERLLGALCYNWGSLFPFQGEMKAGAALAAFFGMSFLCFAIIYLFRNKAFSAKVILLCSALAFVSVLRYMVLSNHSYLHYFFTYRAQLTTVTAMLFCTWQFGLGCVIGNKRK